MSVFPRGRFFYAEFEIQGHRFCRSTRCTSRREALIEEKRFKAEAHTKLAERRRIQPLTLDDAFGRFWREKSGKFAPAWAIEVQRYITQILAVLDPQMLVEDLADVQVNDFVQERVATGGGPYAINRALAVLRGMHNRARKKWGQKTAVIDWADHLSAEAKRVRTLTLEEVRRLIELLPVHIGLAVEWSVITGTRQQETFGLSWDTVYLDNGFATVRAKGDKQHVVWLTPQALDILARVTRREGLVFDERNRRRAWESAVQRAGLVPLRWHDLRHCHASWLRAAGVPLEVVQRSLGHEDIETTLRYAHVADGELAEALRRLPSISPSPTLVVDINSLKGRKKR
jgi:integrase